jgi:nucleoside phosphorylase
MFICAGESEQFDFAVPVGIGLEDVAINLTQLCMLKKPEFLFFVGTAGSYGKKEIFEIIESKTATQIEHAFLMGNAYTPIDNMLSTAYGGVKDTSPSVPSLRSQSSLASRDSSHVSRETRQTDDNSLSSVGLKPESLCDSVAPTQADIWVNSSNYITTNEKIAARYLSKGIDLENMEFYAVLKVAKKFGIPAAGAFVVTNYCHADAHREFIQNHQEAMKRLTDYIKK